MQDHGRIAGSRNLGLFSESNQSKGHASGAPGWMVDKFQEIAVFHKTGACLHRDRARQGCPFLLQRVKFPANRSIPRGVIVTTRFGSKHPGRHGLATFCSSGLRTDGFLREAQNPWTSKSIPRDGYFELELVFFDFGVKGRPGQAQKFCRAGSIASG